MLFKLLAMLVPFRLLGLLTVGLAALQLGGVDVFGMAVSELANQLDWSSWFEFNGGWF